MGSLVFSGQLAAEKALGIVDPEGVSVGQALQDTLAAEPGIARRPTGFPAAAYIETHIEQGPVLEAEDKTIGVVTGIQEFAGTPSRCWERKRMPVPVR